MTTIIIAAAAYTAGLATATLTATHLAASRNRRRHGTIDLTGRPPLTDPDDWFTPTNSQPTPGLSSRR